MRIEVQRRHAVLLLVGLFAIVGTRAGCARQSAIAQINEARRLSAALLIDFTRASDAANRAVMADTDEQSKEFAGEAEMATRSVEHEIGELEPILDQLGDADERLLAEFKEAFAKYRALDDTILRLAVENSNLKAQRLSFGPVQAAAEAVQQALDPVVHNARPNDAWHARALIATAVAAVREIQVLQAPHIAEADAAAMTRTETTMAAEQTEARTALDELAKVVEPRSRPQVASAVAALDHFIKLNKQVIDLSRRNTNVRSLALSLGEKRKLTAACQDKLRALRTAIEQHGFPGTR